MCSQNYEHARNSMVLVFGLLLIIFGGTMTFLSALSYHRRVMFENQAAIYNSVERHSAYARAADRRWDRRIRLIEDRLDAVLAPEGDEDR